MRIICLSDTHKRHTKLGKIPKGDLLLFAGDIDARTLHDVREFDEWLGDLPHRHKIWIAGNHDFIFEADPFNAQAQIKHATYLQDSEVIIEGLKIYGSPWQPWFFDWAFNLERGAALQEKWALIPNDTDILVTHGPPYGILDRTARGELVGCQDLLDRVKIVQPKLHLFGHIHEAYGEYERTGTKYVNASICNLQYQPVNAPVVVEI